MAADRCALPSWQVDEDIVLCVFVGSGISKKDTLKDFNGHIYFNFSMCVHLKNAPTNMHSTMWESGMMVSEWVSVCMYLMPRCRLYLVSLWNVRVYLLCDIGFCSQTSEFSYPFSRAKQRTLLWSIMNTDLQVVVWRLRCRQGCCSITHNASTLRRNTSQAAEMSSNFASTMGLVGSTLTSSLRCSSSGENIHHV
jgi:hypothetical protein